MRLILASEFKFLELIHNLIFESIDIERYTLKEEVLVPCPNRLGDHKITMNDMQVNLSTKNFNDVGEKLLEIYLCNTGDIRKGPNSECSNAGVIIQRPGNKYLVCEMGDYQWKDATQYSLLESIKMSLFGNQSFNSELLSYLSELMRGEPCPSGGIIIIKISGCPHMVCQKGSFEFCWDCLGYYKDYQHIGDTAGPLRVFILYPIVGYFLVAINFKLGYSFNLISQIEKTIIYFIFMVIISTLILASLSIEVAIADKLNRYK